MKSVKVLTDCRSLNTAAEMNCPMPRSVEKVPIRNEKRCTLAYPPGLRSVDYGCFDGQRKLDHTTERL